MSVMLLLNTVYQSRIYTKIISLLTKTNNILMDDTTNANFKQIPT